MARIAGKQHRKIKPTTAITIHSQFSSKKRVTALAPGGAVVASMMLGLSERFANKTVIALTFATRGTWGINSLLYIGVFQFFYISFCTTNRTITFFSQNNHNTYHLISFPVQELFPNRSC